jgi:hypothetical protein
MTPLFHVGGNFFSIIEPEANIINKWNAYLKLETLNNFSGLAMSNTRLFYKANAYTYFIFHVFS